MNEIQSYTIEVLRELIKTNKEEYLLFKSASRRSGDTELKSLFAAYAVQKEESITNLENEVSRLGGNPKAGKNYEGISDGYYESSIFEKNWEKLIADCLAKDELAMNKYFYAIRKNIMWEVVPLIAKQYFHAKSLHDLIRNIYTERSGSSCFNMNIH